MSAVCILLGTLTAVMAAIGLILAVLFITGPAAPHAWDESNPEDRR